MKIVKYQCDLCKEVKEKQCLMAFYFDCGILPQGYDVRPISSGNECDKHICDECIRAVKKYNP